ncbi:zinc finger BED domain-containing protein 1-like protein [Aphelenchoides avenae]|nr:zinc finger BED domain-containing protein 1-like protein [Aphelenchus avenae]
MSLVWEFFKMSGVSVAQCKVAECEWTKDIDFDEDRLEEYKQWLIKEAAKVVRQGLPRARMSKLAAQSATLTPTKICGPNTSIHSPPSALSQLHKAEIEVNEYLMAKKLPTKTGDPYAYWTGENAVKWPLLANLFSKYNSCPATSSESERLFSSAGIIVSDFRKRLTPQHVEQLLFLHHNLLIYNLEY